MIYCTRQIRSYLLTMALIGALAICLVDQVRAEFWAELGKTAVDTVYLDITSVSIRPEGTVQAWFKYVPTEYGKQWEAEQWRKSGLSKEVVNERLLIIARTRFRLRLREYDSEFRQYRDLQASEHDANGHPLEVENTPTPWNFLTPGTSGAGEADAVRKLSQAQQRR